MGRHFVHGHNKGRTGKILRAEPFPPANPSGLCMCGCGERTAVATRANVAKQIEKGHSQRYLPGHSPSTAGQFQKGRKTWNDRNGAPRYNARLNRWVVTREDGRRDYRYRVVAEQKLGRALFPEEVVHHVNGDPTDDRPENLHVFPSQHAHTSFHAAQRATSRRTKST